MIDDWRKGGYTVKLIYLSLTSSEGAIARVAMRVQQGGHDIVSNSIENHTKGDFLWG
jgi:predicted ABC-type ATPase